MNLNINIDVKRLSFPDCLELIEEILNSVNVEGQIEQIRNLINDKKYDDQPPE